jgi:hypothetical protein
LLHEKYPKTTYPLVVNHCHHNSFIPILKIVVPFSGLKTLWTNVIQELSVAALRAIKFLEKISSKMVLWCGSAAPQKTGSFRESIWQLVQQ